MTKICFVCHGNICRSTMAEFVMKDLVKKEGLENQFYIQSRATHRDELGADTHWGTREKLDQEGIPYSKRKATLMTKEDYGQYDYILGMDEENIRYIDSIIGDDPEHKVHMLMDYAGEHRRINDPWYTGNFDDTFRDVMRGCKGLFKNIIKKRNNIK
ncbi:MAG: low molecular weight phosphotyrosine protein phosphatase [Anaerovibrio sp.]|uniref:low molecular weight protein-tyrosine-phosphatase n=1 Tax=Anaerovibrio sp. TaxID=1872532 RepID=UPI0025F271E1|nr:low molecular weight protein-tyrosine-phosphatase [Anaerovibrio sp.]MCR5177183.1 low molecular weight phosphotyrosine protein phosphatase [Anaerovibrio sp.]